jgi:hypothetical protein
MPFRSRKQSRWAFATDQPFAHRWAHQTNYGNLKDAGTDAGAQAHGPGGLMSTPGLGSPSRARKWGKKGKAARGDRNPLSHSSNRTRATPAGAMARQSDAAINSIAQKAANYSARAGETIVGNLKRGAGGKFSSAGAANAPVVRGTQYSKQPKLTAPKAPAGAKHRGGKGKKGGAKPKAPKLTPGQRQAERQAKQAKNTEETLSKFNIAPDGQAALEALRKGDQPDADAIARGGFEQAGLVERADDGSFRMTASGRALMAAAASGDAGRAGDVISSARDRTSARTTRQNAAAERRKKVEARRRSKQPAQTTKAERFGGKKRSDLAESDFAGPNRTYPIMSAKDVQDAARLIGHAADPAAVKKKIIAIAKRKGFPIPDAWKTEKAFTVFKDASGKQRWILRTSTAFRDRDGEVITTKAQEDDAARMTATGQYGPLRYWHIGQPDPFDPVAPWGPGCDLGTCDYSTVIGRTRIESGTFYDAAIGNAIARSADDYEGSPGFFHALDQPDAGAHYTQVRGFERSLVPTKHARASNLFTGLAVGRSTKSMDQETYNKRVAAFLQDMAGKGVAPEVAAGVIAQQQANEKDADDQQIAYKSEDVAPPGPPEELTINGVVYALKAAPPPPPPAETVVETQAAGDEASEDPAMEGTPEDQAQDEGDYLGDMNIADFEAMLASALSTALAPLVKGIDIAGKMSGHMDELKSMMGGYATKSEGVQAEITALKARLAELEGSQPAVILSDDVAAALKSTGPAAPPDQSKQPVIPNDPDRPYAAMTAGMFPELYGGQPPAN